MYAKLTFIAILVISVTCTIASANKVSTTEKINVTELMQQLKLYKQKINQLNKTINQLKTKNDQLETKLMKLQSKSSTLSKWDARKIMDDLSMYHYTEGGKKYELLFHYGGLGGVSVYQYVGVGLGDAGELRQYKLIAHYSGQKSSEGFEKPGIVLNPVWGFNDSSIKIKTISDIIKLENEINNVRGMNKYFLWLQNKYKEATKINGFVYFIIFATSFIIGAVIGESKRPLYRITDAAVTRIMTDFGDRKEQNKILVPVLIVTLLLTVVTFVITQNIVLSFVVTAIGGSILWYLGNLMR